MAAAKSCRLSKLYSCFVWVPMRCKCYKSGKRTLMEDSIKESEFVEILSSGQARRRLVSSCQQASTLQLLHNRRSLRLRIVEPTWCMHSTSSRNTRSSQNMCLVQSLAFARSHRFKALHGRSIGSQHCKNDSNCVRGGLAPRGVHHADAAHSAPPVVSVDKGIRVRAPHARPKCSAVGFHWPCVQFMGHALPCSAERVKVGSVAAPVRGMYFGHLVGSQQGLQARRVSRDAWMRMAQ